MAATRIIPLHTNKGRTMLQTLRDRTDYSQNAAKTENGKYISSYEYDPRSVDEEFMLSKREYQHKYGSKGAAAGREVIAYQIRQSFKPGEVLPEEANKIGYELAMRFTKGKYAFIVATHTDRHHIHNHIVFNSTSIDGTRKFRNFFLSFLAVQRLSDMICLQHGLSVIEQAPRNKPGTTRSPAKKRTYSKYPAENRKQGLNLLIDINRKLADGKAGGYIRWAKNFNSKQIAAAVLFLEEQKITSMVQLRGRISESEAAFSAMSSDIAAKQEELQNISSLRQKIFDYSDTRKVYEEYRKHGYSKAFLEAHREEITIHKSAKQYFNATGMKKLPTVRELNDRYRQIAGEKNEKYEKYRDEKKKLQQLQTAQRIAEEVLKENEDRDKKRRRQHTR